jgi:hypothetical protein
VKERIARALRIYKEAAAAEDDHDGGGVLVQVWAPARAACWPPGGSPSCWRRHSATGCPSTGPSRSRTPSPWAGRAPPRPASAGCPAGCSTPARPSGRPTCSTTAPPSTRASTTSPRLRFAHEVDRLCKALQVSDPAVFLRSAFY